jgi:hypothetical membrane protein
VSTSSTVTTRPQAPPASSAVSAPIRALSRTAVGSAAAAVGAILVAGLVDPGYSAVSEGISALASHESQAAPIMIVGFMAMALALLTAGVALFRLLPTRRAKAAAILVVLSGLATVVVGFARLDCSTLQTECLAREHAETVSGGHVLHNLVSLLLFVLLSVAAFLWGAGLRRLGERRLARITLLAAVLTVAFFVWFMSGAYGSAGGLVQRVFIPLAYGWPVLLAGLLSHRRAGR